MKRKIIKIDEEKCTGCGACTTICAEAALEIVNGKAKLVKDFLCDGMGACLNVCPVDALHVVEEESEGYDPLKAYEHVKEVRGETEAKKVHDYNKIADTVDLSAPMKCGCPGTMMRDFRQTACCGDEGGEKISAKSALRQWPIQLHLLMPGAPYFKDADLAIVADCVPFAFANFHERFLKNKTLIMFCPKLDEGQDEYLEKLTEIFKTQNIKSITIVHMEVPCCGGVGRIVEQALKNSGANIVIKDYTISISGEIV